MGVEVGVGGFTPGACVLKFSEGGGKKGARLPRFMSPVSATSTPAARARATLTGTFRSRCGSVSILACQGANRAEAPSVAFFARLRSSSVNRGRWRTSDTRRQLDTGTRLAETDTRLPRRLHGTFLTLCCHSLRGSKLTQFRKRTFMSAKFSSFVKCGAFPALPCTQTHRGTGRQAVSQAKLAFVFKVFLFTAYPSTVQVCF